MPGVAGPDPFGVVALDNWPITLSTRRRAWTRRPGRRGADRCADRVVPATTRLGRANNPPGRGSSRTDPQRPAVHPDQQLLGQGQVMQVGRGEVAVTDHSGPAHPQMRPEPVVGLLGALVTAEGGQPGQPPATVGPTEAADRHRKLSKIETCGSKADLGEQLLARLGLDRPQIRRLAHEGGAVDARKGREPLAPVAAEVLVQALVGVDAEELANTLNGQDLAVGQDRLWPR